MALEVHGGDPDRYRAGRPDVLWARLVGDLETPVSAYLKLAGRTPSFLLESVEGGETRGRYSVIGLAPDRVFRIAHGQASVAETWDAPARPLAEPPLLALRREVEAVRIDLPADLPPMAAGLFGYLGYDLIRLVEPIGPERPDALDLPDAVLVRPTIVLVFDAVRDDILIVTPLWPDPGLTAEAARAAAVARLDHTVAALGRPVPAPEPPARGSSAHEPFAGSTPVSNTSPERYLAMVAEAKAHIAAGDAFQIVLSQRFACPFALPPFALYRALRRINPSPYLYFLDFGGFALAGSSPEILVRVRAREVTVRPIAGTLPRGATPEEDRAQGARLLADPKERAEHLMLLDLGRNDVGRVAEIGSVVVKDAFFLERYSHVMHIVSDVRGTLAADQDALSALIAGFPAGTVSGAPKVRAMQIIDALEQEKRGIYAGAVGYAAANGDLDTCIVLRTALVKDGVLYAQAGAGIVADSVPEQEAAECASKARALFRAAEEAVRFASRTAARDPAPGDAA